VHLCCPVCQLRAPWVSLLITAARWTKRGRSLGDLVVRPSPAIVQGILVIEQEVAALEVVLNEDASRRAEIEAKRRTR